DRARGGADQPRPLGRARAVRPRRGDAPGRDRRSGAGRGRVPRAAAPVYAQAAARHPPARSGSGMDRQRGHRRGVRMSGKTDDILLSGSIADIGAAYRRKELSAADAVAFYLGRIAKLNPNLNAVREVSARAADDAKRADADLAAGRDAGPLHGI